MAKNKSGKPMATPNDFLIARIPKMTPQERWDIIVDLIATAIARWEFEPKGDNVSARVNRSEGPSVA